MSSTNHISNILCSKCEQPGEFRLGHRQCRDCEKAAGRERYKRNADKAAAYRKTHREKYRKQNVKIARRRKAERHAALDLIKSVPCTDCGTPYPPYVMDFDHRDPSTKKYGINFLLHKTTCPWSRIIDEIAKCDVVCVCCHRMRTWCEPKNQGTKSKLIQALKAVPCTDCGGSFHYCQLDFDHVRGEKLCCVPHAGSKSAIRAEAAKCDVVCANCHRERSQKQGTQRLVPATVDMVWQVRREGSLQSVVVPLERGRETPAERPWHKWAGTMSDDAVGVHHDVSPASVCLYRKKMEIPSFRSTATATAEWHRFVGAESDKTLADRLGISCRTITRHRNKYDLAVYRQES